MKTILHDKSRLPSVYNRFSFSFYQMARHSCKSVENDHRNGPSSERMKGLWIVCNMHMEGRVYAIYVDMLTHSAKIRG